MFKASDYRNTGLRARHHTPWGAKPYTDYVCGKCTVIVLDPKAGCPSCKEGHEKDEAAKEKARVFFAEQKAKRAREKAESERLTREAITARKQRNKP
jgi:hypothetical protein